MDVYKLDPKQAQKTARLLSRHLQPAHLVLPEKGTSTEVKVYDTMYRHIGTITVSEAFKL